MISDLAQESEQLGKGCTGRKKQCAEVYYSGFLKRTYFSLLFVLLAFVCVLGIRMVSPF